MERGSFQAMKQLNKTLILNMILHNSPISRAEIAKKTKLTPPTVGSLVKELIDQHIVKENNQGVSSGGRKPKLLVIDHDAFYMIGVDAGAKKVDVILTNLKADIMDQSSAPVIKTVTKTSYLRLIVDQIEEIMARNGKYAGRLMGIGVAMHGVVDAKLGVGLYAPNLNMRHLNIKETLIKHFDTFVCVENDARALTQAEVWFGQGKGVMNLLTVNIDSGVGAGLVIAGEIYRGNNHIAGEIGHMTIDIFGEVCSCGNRGCLETIVSTGAIEKKAEKEIANGVKTTLTNKVTIDQIFSAAREGDRFSQSLLKATGAVIGTGLTNAIHMVNPDHILLTGKVLAGHEYVLPEIKKTVERRGLTEKAKKTPVSISTLGDKAAAIGAVALVLALVFKENVKVLNK